MAFPIVIFSQYPMADIMFSAVSAIGCYEMLSCLGYKRRKRMMIPTVILAALLPLICRFDHYTGLNFFNGTETNVLITFLLLIMFMFFTFSIFSKGAIDIQEAGFAAIMVIYIIGGSYAAIYVARTEYGQVIFPLIFVTSWITDVFAYFTGYLFGRHKLIPNVSPKKTVEGSVGGMLFCAVSFIVYGFIVSKIMPGYSPHYLVLALIALVLSVISQIGDLLMSIIKRKHGIKDYGKLFAGHGGVLDRFDSILAISFVFCLLCSTGELILLFK